MFVGEQAAYAVVAAYALHRALRVLGRALHWAR